MSNKLKDLYDKVFEKISPEIRYLKEGILYQSIQIILLDIEQIEASTICKKFDIKQSAYKDEDISFANDLRDIFISEIYLELEAVKLLKTTKDKLFNDKNGDKKMEELKWIVIAACTVVGAYFCIQYLKEQENKKNKNQLVKNYTREELETTSRQRLLVPAALCLIVPANIVGELTNGSSINIDDLSYLIDSASDFICAAKADADSIEQQMSMTDKIPSDSIREVYIRINLADGRNLIGKKILYMIKTNLPIDTDFFVKKVACLQNLNGLKFFNHV
jgi:hypothetical protein